MSLELNKVLERSVDSVGRIYAVVIGLSLSQSVQTFITQKAEGGADLNTARLLTGAPAFVAFLVTLVPFWHGMNRHLDRCYLEKTESVSQGALLFDFATFFLEAILLFVAGWSLRSGLVTFYCLGLLLIIDTIWGFISHQIHSRGDKSHVLWWGVINIIATVIAIFTIESPFEHKPLLLMVISIVRSIGDYWQGWSFYFPVAHTKAERVRTLSSAS